MRFNYSAFNAFIASDIKINSPKERLSGSFTMRNRL